MSTAKIEHPATNPTHSEQFSGWEGGPIPFFGRQMRMVVLALWHDLQAFQIAIDPNAVYKRSDSVRDIVCE